ncbi:M28 family peptidase [Shewanella sp. WXL01]|uniref:M28 family metallopeptidase n=1 Tax=Shewanella sp. WXL01 TaxID=2709721 RepID=UPI0014384664|nr:M28 family metallopeptidase [Shewanella sp. WXL01]NKF52442.1 M28 family peptidase [Shewanella sp. WXL01]
MTYRAPIFALTLCALATGCNDEQPSLSIEAKPAPSIQVSFNESRFRQDIKTLASDEFEGRAPTTKGEKLTLDYLSAAFKEMGLQGANNGSYLQAVPMVSYTASEQQTISFNDVIANYRDDIVLNTRHDTKAIDIKQAPLVFVGYGINAPEYQWNDYQDIDMRGKIAVILINDPGFAHPESQKFNGKAMTYYGRWSYKFEEASRQGALGAIIIHDTKPASYPWSVVENSWTGPQQDLASAKNSENNRVMVEGWMTKDLANELFTASGHNLTNVADRAASGPLNLLLKQRANIAFGNKTSYSDSYNVVATLPGSSKANEHIMFTAHWDHLGKDTNKQGDNIYNGALDNASGTAGIMEIARMFAEQADKGGANQRSVTFIATTGEEQGLLGSRYYADNPIYPIDDTIAVFNVDSTNIYGKTKDYTIIGKGQSELEQLLITEVEAQGRKALRESRPESGGFFRSDQFSFAKKGVPAVFAGSGSTPLDEASAQYKARMLEIMKGCYHNVCDEYRDDWDLSGAIQDLNIYFNAAYKLANSKQRPGYYPQSEFHRLRPSSNKVSE